VSLIVYCFRRGFEPVFLPIPPLMASPSHPLVVTSHPVTSTPQPSPSHSEADKEILTLPHTPTSTATSGASSSRRHPAHTPQHRKASSVSSPRPAAKVVSRSLSLRESQVRSLTPDELNVSEREGGGAEKRESVMVTPPENLPPSPPLTSQETDGDEDVDSEEAVQGESQAEHEHEQDVTEGWQHRDTAARRSRELADRDHPLSEGLSGDARVDIDLERGRDEPEPRERTRPSIEADVAEHSGVTKPFEIIRRPRRLTSPKPPHSSYYMGPPTGTTAYSTPPCGQIGLHHPREIVRIERDYDHGELVQFSTSYPLELQGRITPTQFLETINALNEGLIRAHSIAASCFDNTLAVLTLWMSTLVLESRYAKEMKRLQLLVDALNAELYNPQGLNILWPRKSAFLFVSATSCFSFGPPLDALSFHAAAQLEIEYYVSIPRSVLLCL
jgi:hypothetical protein